MVEQGLKRRELLKMGLVGTAVAATAVSATQVLAQSNSDEASTLQRVLKTGELRIGVTHSEPWFAKDQRTGEWSGVGWAAGVAMAKELDVKPKPVETTWGNAVAGLQAGQYDLMFVLDATPKRALAVDFPVQPMLYYAMGVLVRDDLPVKNWTDLNKEGVRVGVTLGSTGDKDVTEVMTVGSVERFPNNDELTAAFQSGRIDALALYHPTLVMQRSRVKMGTVVLPQPIRPISTSVGVRREDDKSWRDWVGLSLAYLYTTGRIQTIYEEHLVSRGIDPKSAPPVVREMWDRT